MERENIYKLAVELSQDVPGSKDFITQYQKARIQVEAKLTDDQRQIYKAMAIEWSEKNLPPKMQQRYAHGNGSSRLESADFSMLV